MFELYTGKTRKQKGIHVTTVSYTGSWRCGGDALSSFYFPAMFYRKNLCIIFEKTVKY
jgi:hypothetical protein